MLVEGKEEQKQYKRFDGAAWVIQQVRSRTRTALRERGSNASTRSREYQIEYQRQQALFHAERAEKKKRKRAEHHQVSL